VTTSTTIGPVDLSRDGQVRRWLVSDQLGVSKIRKLWAVTGAGPGCAMYGVHNNDKSNLLRGVYERVLYRIVDGVARLPPSPAVGVFDRELGNVRERIVREIPTCRPITLTQVVELYEGRRKEIYQRAALSLAARPLQKSDSYVSTFTKCEKINFFLKPDPAPRVIQPRSPRFNAMLARYLKRLEKKVVNAVAEVWNGTTIMKGLNAEGAGAAMAQIWAEFDDPVAIPLDATRFDQHVSKQALEWEHSVYLKCFDQHDRAKLGKLLSMQLVNRGFGRVEDCKLDYEVEGRRMSGDMNTGMGNCLLMCSILYAFKTKCRVKMRLANNGDDCVIFVERRDVWVKDKLSAHMLKFGFPVEIEETVDVLEQVSFCQTNPIYDGERWIMMRDPRVCIDKDLCSVLDLGNQKGASKWAHAIGTCGLAMTAGLPVMDAFYTMLIRHGTKGSVIDSPWMDSGFKRMAAGLDRKANNVSTAARVSFWRAFGILPDMQVSMEKSYIGMQLNFSAGVSDSPFAYHALVW